jgi:S-adenosylhomocysteine hydrolase
VIDNICDTGQSALNDFISATNLFIVGSNVAIAGYRLIRSEIAKRIKDSIIGLP